jgi:hypothetical protein
MDGARIVLLYHAENSQLPSTIRDIFGGATRWHELDLADADLYRLMRTKLSILSRHEDAEELPVPVLLRHGNHRSGKSLVEWLCSRSFVRLRVIVHCTEFVRSFGPGCMARMDHVVVEKRGGRLRWPRALFKTYDEFYDCARRSTSELVGIDLQKQAFAEYRLEGEDASAERCRERCARVLEELMAATWHPRRFRAWCLDHRDPFAEAG